MSSSPIRWFDPASLSRIRKKQGWSIPALALEAEVAPATIRHWESGRYLPSMQSLAPVLEALDLPPAAVITIPPGAATLADLRALSLHPSIDVADDLGITLSMLYSIERGESPLTENRLSKLSSLYDVSEALIVAAWERGGT